MQKFPRQWRSLPRNEENYWELVWVLARTDFKLRYHGSILGYVWVILKPLSMYFILNFVFSSIFNPMNTGTHNYSLQLLSGIVIFNFFSEGTIIGMGSLYQKSALITKIHVPSWTVILASTIQSSLIFFMNLFIVILFFTWYRYCPSLLAITICLHYILLTYIIILSFSLITAPLYARYRDLMSIWEVLLSALFYATPIIYPLTILPDRYQSLILANPMAYIIHTIKIALTEGHTLPLWQDMAFTSIVLVFLILSISVYRKSESKVVEHL
ncbi:MAG: ABC transporter permease [Syntrophobacteraceae bacterium]